MKKFLCVLYNLFNIPTDIIAFFELRRKKKKEVEFYIVAKLREEQQNPNNLGKWVFVRDIVHYVYNNAENVNGIEEYNEKKLTFYYVFCDSILSGLLRKNIVERTRLSQLSKKSKRPAFRLAKSYNPPEPVKN